MALIFDNTGAGNITLKSPTSGTYTLTLPTTAGTSGYFLQTDGNGTLTWASSGGLSSMPDGNATTPGLAFTADADTGFYRPSANTLGISTFATQRFLIDADGNVVVGTAALLTTATDGFLYIPTTTGTPTGTPTTYAGRSALIVDTSNNILYGYDPVDAAWLNLTGGAGGVPGGSDTYVQFNDGGSFGGDAGLTYNKTTDTLTSGAYIASMGSVGTPAYSFSGDTNTGIYSSAADTVNVSTAGVLRFTITSTGNVVVGTAALLTTATDGFLYITGMPGIPTGTPTTHTGRYPLTFDNASKKLNIYNGSEWQDINSPRIKTDSWSATPTVDWSNADVVRMTLTGNTIFTFTGAVDGQRCLLEVTQDGSGSHTVTLGSEVRYGTDLTSYTATITALKKDRIVFIYDGTASKYDVVSIIKGF